MRKNGQILTMRLFALPFLLISPLVSGCSEPAVELPAQRPLLIRLSARTGPSEAEQFDVISCGPIIDPEPLFLVDQTRLASDGNLEESENSLRELANSLIPRQHPTNIIVCPSGPPRLRGGLVATNFLFDDQVLPAEHDEIVAFLITVTSWPAGRAEVRRLAPNVFEVVHATPQVVNAKRLQLEKIAGKWQVRSPTVAMPKFEDENGNN